MACSVGKVCTYTQLNDSVQHVELKRKTRRDETNTGCCWNKLFESKSLKSSDSVQRIVGRQGDPGRTRMTTGKPEEACGKYCSSSVHPDRFPPFVSQAWWYTFSASVLVETGPARNLSTHSFCSSTHHDDLDCGAAAAFQKLRLGAACGVDCGAAAAFESFIFSFYFDLLLTLCYVMLATFFVAESHSIDVSRWSALIISFHSRIIFMSFF